MTFREWMGGRMTTPTPVKASVSPKTVDHDKQRLPERSVLSDKMIQFVCHHFVGLDAAALREYTFERHKTEYPDAKADLDIFDDAGRLIFQGREFHSGMAGYWRPSRVSMAPHWASNEDSWGRPASDQTPIA
jgi:hypothetical protein